MIMRLAALAALAVSSCSCFVFPEVAFRAISPLCPRDMATVLAGEGNVRSVLLEARRLRKLEGPEVSREFLDAVPRAYLRRLMQVQRALAADPSLERVVVLDADMDTMPYDASFLRDVDVVEVADKSILHVKEQLIARGGAHVPLLARSVTRVTDVSCVDWSSPALLVMSRGARPLPKDLPEGSAVVCCGDLDCFPFERASIRKTPDAVHVTAFGYGRINHRGP